MGYIKLGNLHRGQFFIYNNNIYRIGSLIKNTNGYVACTDVVTHYVTRFHVDTVVVGKAIS